MDVELLTPDKNHEVGVNEYAQDRNELTYKYRRLLHRHDACKASDKLNIHLSQGTYRLSVGIYGEDYSSLQQSAKRLKSC